MCHDRDGGSWFVNNMGTLHPLKWFKTGLIEIQCKLLDLRILPNADCGLKEIQKGKVYIFGI